MKEIHRRGLGLLEAAMAGGNNCPGDSNIVCLIELDVSKEIDGILFEKVVNRVIHLNPNLRATITMKEGATEETWLTDLFELIYYDQPIGKVFEHRILDTPWEANQFVPDVEAVMGFGETQFRCILVESSDSKHLIVIYSHAIGDGTSGMIITNDILSLYDQALVDEGVLSLPCEPEFVKTWPDTIQPHVPNGDDILERINLDAENAHKNWKGYHLPYTFTKSGKNGYMMRKGSKDALNGFKVAAKKNGLTIGVCLAAAVDFVFQKFKKSRHATRSIDVNLRGRLGADTNKYKGVGMLIGIFNTNLKESGNEFDFESGDVDFWEYAKAMKQNINENLSQGSHLAFYKHAEQQMKAGVEVKYDINISSIGRYPFDIEHKNAGIKMTGYWTAGPAGACPTWGSMVLLVQSLEMQCYSLQYYDEGNNTKVASTFLELVMDLCENHLIKSESLMFNKWNPTMPDFNGTKL